MISTLYDYKVPSRGKSTYNVGMIQGGTSVNTIAQEVHFLFEYRSDHREDLKEMKHFFESVIETYKNMNLEVNVTLLGERPCMGDVQKEQMKTILSSIDNIIWHHTHTLPTQTSGSTDCNISYSMGIAGACFGGYKGYGAHTREERLEIASLSVGMKIVMDFILNYFL